MPGVDFREARARLPLAAVLGLLGFEARTRRGDEVRGPCPVHRSRSAASRAFAAHLGKGAWHCFACGAGGNALDLWAAVTGQGVHAAVLDLCRRLGRPVPWAPPVRRPPSPAGPRAPDRREVMPDP